MADYENETEVAAVPSAGADTPVQPEKKPEPDEATKAFVKGWCDRINAAKKYHDKAFKRMRTCMQIAKTGGSKDWVGDDPENGRFTVPIIKRHINQAVAQLYAKNPKSWAERKRRRMNTVWDGTLAQLQEATQQTQANTDRELPPDPNFVAILSDAAQVQRYNRMMDGLADTLMILHEYYMNEQTAGFKRQAKALVRRVRVCGVGYITLGFQRILEKRPDVTAQISDVTDQIASIEQRMREAARDELPEDSAKYEELRTMLADLQAKEDMIVREGPVFGFPKATAVIIDPACVHLTTLAGAGWWAEEFSLTPEEIEATYKVDVRDDYKKYDRDKNARPKWSEKKGKTCDENEALVWRVQDRRTGQEFTICEGYCGYLKPPAAPDVRLERFFTIFPLVFNETEDEDDIFPASDVWDARHIQEEYNRARHGLSEHRRQNKPGYYSPQGALSDPDKEKLANRVSGGLVEVQQMAEGQKLADKLGVIPTAPIDPNVYEVEGLYNDLLRVVGAQQANLGATGGDTATESSIAENSRALAEASNVDDLDDMLSDLARSLGQLMLAELSKDTVVEIVGPGAVWPDMPQSREEIAKDLMLNIKAGSSGRPNRAAELANMERGMPMMIQLPGINPAPIAEKYLNLLDIDLEGAVIEGMPSIMAMNAMITRQAGAQAPTGDPRSDPGSQGGEGASNDRGLQQNENEPGAQPAMPTPLPV